MQIVIPMSGFGERFRRVGYTVPKPLIEIEGKPIIAHVVDMFPGETDFIFVCNQEHLDSPAYRMREILVGLCPTGTVVGIPPHKLGPIHAVQQVESLLDPQRPVVVNYCDFTCYWDWRHFKEYVAGNACAGAIPAYKGFHPHSLGKTNYAYMREKGGWLQDIQEKQPFTDDRMQEYASSGTYYFATAAIMADAFRAVVEEGLSVGGEYYVSLSYKPLLKHDMPVCVYPLQHFMQWGTPEDVHEYNVWSDIFHRLIDQPRKRQHACGTVVVPMAGLGKRFLDEGYSLTKPLIPVSGQPMVVQATKDLPDAENYAFVLRSDMTGHDDVVTELQQQFPNPVIESIEHLTEGQACTALIGLKAIEKILGAIAGPVTIGACDNGALYDAAQYDRLLSDPDVDVVVWGVQGYPNAVRNPKMYGWIDEESGEIRSVSVKCPLKNPEFDPIVLGTFTFKRAEDYQRAYERMWSREGRVNGEYYGTLD